MLELYRRLGCYPRFCVWELTLACNMRCRHCGSHAGEPRPVELGLRDCLRIADELAELGCEKVTLSGGEPTLAPHWDAVGRRLHERGVRVNLISNGWRWSDRELEKARAAGLRDVAFSLDGLEAAHDEVRRAGSFRRVVQAIERCAAGGLPVSVLTTINQRNRRTLGEVRELLAGLGVTTWQVQLGVASGAMSDHADLVLEPADLLWLVPELAQLCLLPGRPVLLVAENIGYYGRFSTVLRGGEGAELPVWYGCSAGLQSLGIESNGNVKGCLSLPSARHGQDRFVEGSLKDRSLESIWRDPAAFAFNRQFTESRLEGFCGCCRYGDICRAGCAWTASSHTGNRYDNPYCFYRQAVEHRRLDLLDEDPTDAELAASRPAETGQPSARPTS